MQRDKNNEKSVEFYFRFTLKGFQVNCKKKLSPFTQTSAATMYDHRYAKSGFIILNRFEYNGKKESKEIYLHKNK